MIIEDLKLLQKDFNKLATSFGRVAQALNTADMLSAKMFIKIEISKVLEYGNEVFGNDELTVIARPYINLSTGVSTSV